VNDAMSRGLFLSAGIDIDANAAALNETARPMGWGLPFRWDAFRQGTSNSADTCYACTTAIVLSGFLDSGKADDRHAEIVVRWARQAWSDGFWWYSEHPRDAIYTPNASALMAGVTQRFVLERPELLDDATTDFLETTAAIAVERLVVTSVERRWLYSAATNETPNCLLHDGFTHWGLETYRASRGRDVIPWAPWDAPSALVGRQDVARWPAAGPALRFLVARRTGFPTDPADLEASPASERDAAFQLWARSRA
jgi:hypothetical protein